MNLSDCVSRNRSENELLIVQDGCYAALAMERRDRMTQAVLTIDASISEIEALGINEVLDDSQVRSVIACLGVGISLGPGCGLSLDALRYRRIVIVTDASPEGRHIREQVVAFFRLYNAAVIEAGFVFLASAEVFADGGAVTPLGAC